MICIATVSASLRSLSRRDGYLSRNHSTSDAHSLVACSSAVDGLMYNGGQRLLLAVSFSPTITRHRSARRRRNCTRAWISPNPSEYYHAFTCEYGGLWRRLGDPLISSLVLCFAAQGFDGGTYCRFQAVARDPRWPSCSTVLRRPMVFCNHGSMGLCAAAKKSIRFDVALGFPHNLRSSVGVRKQGTSGDVRARKYLHVAIVPARRTTMCGADMTFFETVAVWAVFSTGFDFIRRFRCRRRFTTTSCGRSPTLFSCGSWDPNCRLSFIVTMIIGGCPDRLVFELLQVLTNSWRHYIGADPCEHGRYHVQRDGSSELNNDRRSMTW